jgi:hypothetical protein
VRGGVFRNLLFDVTTESARAPLISLSVIDVNWQHTELFRPKWREGVRQVFFVRNTNAMGEKG